MGTILPSSLIFFDFNSYVLNKFSFGKAPTPSAIYIPQQIVIDKEISKVNILILGGSSIREFFPRSENIDTTLSNMCGQPLHVLNAGTSSQSLADSLSIIDSAYHEGMRPDVIIVGMTKFRLSQAWENWSDVITGQRLALPISQKFFSKLENFEAIGWRMRDRFNQVTRVAPLLRMDRFVGNGDINAIQDLPNYAGKAMSDQKKLEQVLVGHELRNLDYLARSEENAFYFSSSFADYADSKTKIIFLFTPLSPVTRHLELANDIPMEAIRNSLQVTGEVIDMQAYDGLDEHVFYDEQHLRPEGRQLVWSAGKIPSPLFKAICGNINKTKP